MHISNLLNNILCLQTAHVPMCRQCLHCVHTQTLSYILHRHSGGILVHVESCIHTTTGTQNEGRHSLQSAPSHVVIIHGKVGNFHWLPTIPPTVIVVKGARFSQTHQCTTKQSDVSSKATHLHEKQSNSYSLKLTQDNKCTKQPHPLPPHSSLFA